MKVKTNVKAGSKKLYVGGLVWNTTEETSQSTP
jgi:hypothetical protein